MTGLSSAQLGITSPRLGVLYEYWGKVCAGRPYPVRADIDPCDLPTRLWPQMFIADVLLDPIDFRFRLAGTRVVENAGLELTGRMLSELPLLGLAPIIEEYKLAVELCEPRYSTISYTSANGYPRSVERLVLPLSKRGGAPDMLIGAFEYHRDPADA